MNPNLQHAIERVERPGGSHEGVGRKKNILSPNDDTCQSIQVASSYVLLTDERLTSEGPLGVCCLPLLFVEEEIERERKQFLELTQPFKHMAQGETL